MFFSSAKKHNTTLNKKGEVTLAFSYLHINFFRILRSLVFVGKVSRP